MVTVQVVCADDRRRGPSGWRCRRRCRSCGCARAARRRYRRSRRPRPTTWTDAERRVRRRALGQPGDRQPRRRSPAQLGDLLRATEADELMITVQVPGGRRADPLARAAPATCSARVRCRTAWPAGDAGLPPSRRRRDSSRVRPAGERRWRSPSLLALRRGRRARRPRSHGSAQPTSVRTRPRRPASARPARHVLVAPSSGRPATSRRRLDAAAPGAGRDERAAAHRPAVHGRHAGDRRLTRPSSPRSNQARSARCSWPATARCRPARPRGMVAALQQQAGPVQPVRQHRPGGRHGPAAAGPGLQRDPERARARAVDAARRASGPTPRCGARSWSRPASTSTSPRSWTPCPSAAFAPDNPPIGALDREFGYTPAAVTAAGTAFLQGLLDAGVDTHRQALPGPGPGHRPTPTPVPASPTRRRPAPTRTWRRSRRRSAPARRS